MNNESIIIFCMFCQCCCWTLYPERGRKHASRAYALVPKPMRLLDSLPREGTETLCELGACPGFPLRRLLDSLPREGTETRRGHTARSNRLCRLLDSLPREGTETCLSAINNNAARLLLLDSLPREGTETLCQIGYLVQVLVSCWTLYPERGRKLERMTHISSHVQVVGLFTPRGDGNLQYR